jgi:L-ascorbate metabolism protein UlaG (beta-lactamase superfamily)
MTATTLLEMLNGFDPPSGTVGPAWLGQAGFVVRGACVTALMDPFLSPFEGRLYGSSIQPERARNIDVVLCTHEHDNLFAGNRGNPAHVVESIAREHPGTAVQVPGRDVPILFTSARPR